MVDRQSRGSRLGLAGRVPMDELLPSGLPATHLRPQIRLNPDRSTSELFARTLRFSASWAFGYKFSRGSYYPLETRRCLVGEEKKPPVARPRKRDWIKVVAGFSAARLEARCTCKKLVLLYLRVPGPTKISWPRLSRLLSYNL